jgi:hypothetical protein
MADGADKQRLGKVLDAYGQAGEKNGVNVSFSKDVQYGQAVREADGSISVTFNTDFKQLRAPAHDGQDSGMMADSIPAAWRTVFRRHAGQLGPTSGIVSGMPGTLSA